MSPKQLRKLIESAGLTISGTARELGMQHRQFYRYLAGEVEVPRVVELALKWVLYARRKKL